MRDTTLFKRLMDLPGVNVTDVEFLADKVVVTVALQRKKLICPECAYTTRARYDTRPVYSTWRHLDFGRWRLVRVWKPGAGMGAAEDVAR